MVIVIFYFEKYFLTLRIFPLNINLSCSLVVPVRLDIVFRTKDFSSETVEDFEIGPTSHLSPLEALMLIEMLSEITTGGAADILFKVWKCAINDFCNYTIRNNNFLYILSCGCCCFDLDPSMPAFFEC